ncbi:hypothetical protein J8273_3712 [Carpediemonas membranifera]|uniref:FHA domain-containing protein n=1 Tax=Carpediemonas membranifera TaxID=201153 RepID=A0A8J6E2U0_9EUKA|nr:hypothetical protein J8273_3712 [Carpediemonas membranifera]|eukprot:KAG9394736.1 hypothetical protein J8273_3712 [Carpediemonas membranifera]
MPRREYKFGPKDNDHVNYGTSGLLQQFTTTRCGRTIQYDEPIDAATPTEEFFLCELNGGVPGTIHPLKHDDDATYTLLGQDPRACPITLDHPSVSQQHAVVQWRRRISADGEGLVVPYLMDINSTNGTTLNGAAVNAERYTELCPDDIIRLGKADTLLAFMQV